MVDTQRVVVFIVAVQRTRDLDWEARCETSGVPFEGWLPGVGWQGILTLHAELDRAAAVSPTQDLLRGNCSVCSDLTCTDIHLAVGENDCL